MAGRTKKKFPEVKKANEGKFTKWAMNNGFKSACSAASAVMKNTKKYSDTIVKQANYANNFGCKSK
tara:strand:- start:5087 stop:5284 length:198 start_codon:yes stop_codon:yes gene_type:complete